MEVPHGWLQVIRGKRPIDAVATCKIPAASSSAWEARAGVGEAADAAAVSQSRECCPRATAGSSSCEDPEGPGLGAPQPEDTEERQVLQSALEKAKRQAQVPPLEKQILATEESMCKVSPTEKISCRN